MDWHARWLERLRRWEDRAEASGLGGVVGTLREGLHPLTPLIAQCLWIAQPTLALLGDADAIAALAELLDASPDPKAGSDVGPPDAPPSAGRE